MGNAQDIFFFPQLAVLGACRCRGSSPEPCRCAHAAANMRREIVKLKQEVIVHGSHGSWKVLGCDLGLEKLWKLGHCHGI